MLRHGVWMVRYINNILVKFGELIDIIKNSSDYKKYKSLQEIMKNDKEIMHLIDEVKSCQKQIVKLKVSGDDITELETIISSNLEKLNNIPLYVEYSYLQADLNELFQIIKNTTEKCLEDITN